MVQSSLTLQLSFFSNFEGSTTLHPNDKPSGSKPGIVYSKMGEFDILGHYSRLLEEDPSKSMPIAAIESLCALCDGIEANTIHELLSTIQLGSDSLKEAVPNAISLTAGCDLFTKFITRHSHDDPRDFDTFKKKLQSNGHLFAQRARKARSIVAENGLKMVMNNSVIFVHGYSRCVMAILLNAREKGRKFKVICTETRPSCQGLRTAKELRAAGISVAVIDDNAVTYAMNKASFALVGAEGTLTDASIINVVYTNLLSSYAYTRNRVRSNAEFFLFTTDGDSKRRTRSKEHRPSILRGYGESQICRHVPGRSVYDPG